MTSLGRSKGLGFLIFLRQGKQHHNSCKVVVGLGNLGTAHMGMSMHSLKELSNQIKSNVYSISITYRRTLGVAF
jgi:hypothetical protein